MRKIKIALFAMLLFCYAGVHAQYNSLRIDSTFLSAVPDTVRFNDTFTVNIIIHNDSLFDYNGVLNIGSQVNNDTARIDSFANGSVYYPASNNIETIPAGGSITRSLIIHITNPPFIIGSSGVVIWPIVQNQQGNLVSSNDSIKKTVTVLNPLGLRDPAERKLKIYMSGRQLVVAGNAEFPLKKLRLYNVSGVLISEQPVFNSDVVDMSQYASGVYFAEVIFMDNARQAVKVVNIR